LQTSIAETVRVFGQSAKSRGCRGHRPTSERMSAMPRRIRKAAHASRQAEIFAKNGAAALPAPAHRNANCKRAAPSLACPPARGNRASVVDHPYPGKYMVYHESSRDCGGFDSLPSHHLHHPSHLPIPGRSAVRRESGIFRRLWPAGGQRGSGQAGNDTFAASNSAAGQAAACHS